MIVMSDHSQTAVESGDQPRRTCSPTCACSARATPRRPRPSWPPVPSARSAMVYALDEARRERAGPARGGHAARGRRGRARDHARGRRGAGALRRGRAALRARRRPRRRARARAGRSRATSRCSRSTRAAGGSTARPTRTRSAGSGRRSRARTRATCWPRPSSATSSSTGAAPTTWAAAATGRSTGTTPRACCSCAGSTRPSASSWSLADVTPLVLEHFGVPLAAVTDEARAAIADRPHAIHLRVRAGLTKPHNWVQLMKFCAVGASGYVVNLCVFAACVELLDLHHLVAATAAFVVAVHEQLLVEPALDVPGARRPRRLPGGPLLHDQHRRRSCSPPRSSSCS